VGRTLVSAFVVQLPPELNDHRWLLRTAPLTVEYAGTVVGFGLRALRPERPARRR
jgi:hypothetical protein